MDESNLAESILLMQKAKAGDKDAFNQLYGQFFVPVYRYLYKRAGNKQDAEDLAQNVFLKVYSSNSVYINTGKSPLNYFFTVARNLLADYWKAQNKNVLLLPRESEYQDPINRLAQVEAKLSAGECLAQLAGEQKQVITLKLIEGFTTSEVADRLRKSPEAIRQIQSRGLKKLRSLTQTA